MRSTYIYLTTVAYCGITIACTLSEIWYVPLLTGAGIFSGFAVLHRYLSVSCARIALITFMCTVAVIIRMQFVSQVIPEVFRDNFDIPQSLEGVVVTIPDIRETSERLTVEISSGIESVRIIAAVPLFPPIHVGERVRVTGTLRQPKPFETDGGRTFAYDSFLMKDGVFGVMQPARVEVLGTDPSVWLKFLRVLEKGKTTLVSFLTLSLPDPENSLAVGLMVGGKQGLGSELLEAFTKAGMLQIIVLSGYNVMIVASTLMRALGPLPKSARFIVGSSSIACFVLIAGSGSSAMRAGLMAFIAIATKTFGKDYEVLPAVCLSLLALLFWKPLLLVFDPGLQFSFIATLGLVLGVPVITPFLLFFKNKTVIELFSTTLAAEITLLPLLLWQTGNLSLVSVFANVIAMPAVPFAMGTSAAVMVIAYPLHFIHPTLPLIAGLPALLPLAYIINVARLSASLPFATISIPAFPFWVVLLSYGVLAAIYARQLRRGIVVRLNPSSSSQETHQRMTSYPPACSQS